MRKTIDLKKKWAFTKEMLWNPAQLPERPYWVNLPHTWNAIDGQDGGGDYDRGTCWYVKELDREEIPEAERYYLEICGANSSADVYVGGRRLAHHDGGYSTWRVDVTDALRDSLVLAIAVDNSPNDAVYPQVADFTFYGGLYRDVRLICVPESHFDLMHCGGPGIMVTPEVNGSDAAVEVQVYPVQTRPGQILRYTLIDGEGSVMAAAVKPVEETIHTFTVKDVHLWHGRRDPYLYRARVELMEAGDALDTVSTHFGVRSFCIDPERGFFLNGEEYPLRGVSRHQDRWEIGNALLREHHEEDMRLILEVGATTVRLAHYQHDQYFYDLCDRHGLVVWAEIPYISQHKREGRDNTVSQLKELIVQNYNHPSIVVWGLSNEITMKGADDPDLVENHRILNDLAHSMDKTRLTAVAAMSICPTDAPYLKIPDVVSWNHYFGWYGGEPSMNGPWLDRFHKEWPDTPVGVSEYGCEGLNWHSSQPVQGDYTEEYQAYYHEELIRQLFARPYLWATHVWNMFDFGADNRCEGGENGQNHKGLVTFDRGYRKDAFYAYKAWLSDEPFVHICGKRYIDRVEAVTAVTVYSNQPEVELRVNGKSLGKRMAADHFFRFEVPNEGESHLLALAGDCRDRSFIRRVDTFNENYRLKEKGAILNWFDVEAPEGYFSLRDKLADVQKNREAAQVIGDMMKQLMQAGGEKAAGFDLTPEMMKMMGGFTILRMTGMLGLMGEGMDKAQLLEINRRLNEIRKP